MPRERPGPVVPMSKELLHSTESRAPGRACRGSDYAVHHQHKPAPGCVAQLGPYAPQRTVFNRGKDGLANEPWVEFREEVGTTSGPRSLGRCQLHELADRQTVRLQRFRLRCAHELYVGRIFMIVLQSRNSASRSMSRPSCSSSSGANQLTGAPKKVRCVVNMSADLS
jgi:hypothetical protein